MKKRISQRCRNKLTKLDRVEKKCNRILSELALLRQSLTANSQSLDDAIERMHRNARRMRSMAEREAEILRNSFLSGQRP